MTGVKRKLADRWKYRPHITNEAQTPTEQARIDYALIFRERIKSLGDDGLKEEFQLRAVESVTRLYLSHHPGADIDTANAVVRAAIASKAERP